MMQTAKINLLDKAFSQQNRESQIKPTHIDSGSPRREEAEHFIRDMFRRHHDALVRSFAPNLLILEEQDRLIAAAGWRGANQEPLFLERYLDEPIEKLMEVIAGHRIARERVVEVGHLASDKPGGSLQIILSLAPQLTRLGYEWVVFTATQELIGIFRRLGLPLLALAKADRSRLGEDAADWGRYYDSQPVVVAGRIRLALERIGRMA